jgi:hypothetical protein
MKQWPSLVAYMAAEVVLTEKDRVALTVLHNWITVVFHDTR